MLPPSTLSLFSASAGAGKTFNLVAHFLSLSLQWPNPASYFQILAITFTNKATAEMKNRVVETLQDWEQTPPGSKSQALLNQVVTLTNLPELEVKKRAQKLLRHIIHHYGHLSISTIDAFQHRIVRTFAQDLELPQAFDIELDADAIMRLAVDDLIEEYGQDDEITLGLRGFLRHMLEEKSGSSNLKRLLIETANALFGEGSRLELQVFENWTAEQHRVSRKKLETLNADDNKTVADLGEQGQNLLLEVGEDATAYPFAALHKYFDQMRTLKASDFKLLHATFLKTFENGGLFKGKAKGGLLLKERQYHAVLYEHYIKCHSVWFECAGRVAMRQHMAENSFTIALLQRIMKAYKNLWLQRHILPLSEVVHLINNELRKEPSAYLFERLGERYRHIFIDEFQDTSQMQWQNLSVLVENACSEGGTAMLVGDAKQAIYRWRNGDVDLFLNLMQKGMAKEVGYHYITLDQNFRSKQNVVNFNNGFFKRHAAVFNRSDHQLLYEQATQRAQGQAGGYIEIVAQKEKTPSMVKQEVLECIKHLSINLQYRLGDVAILVRSNKFAADLTEFLTENGILVSGEQSHTLSASAEVRLLVALLQLHIIPQKAEARQSIYQYLLEQSALPANEDPFNWGMRFSKTAQPWPMLDAFFPGLWPLPLGLGLYDELMHFSRSFGLLEKNPVFVLSFLEHARNQALRNGNSRTDFLIWYEEKGQGSSIEAPPNADAVQIMTIHKSKGLEFPVVLMPQGNMPMNDVGDAYIWQDLEPAQFGDYKRFPFRSDRINWQERGNYQLAEQYAKAKDQTLLDNMNLLYVGMTRAVDRLHIFLGPFTGRTNSSKLLYMRDFFEAYFDEAPTEDTQYGFKVCFGESEPFTITANEEHRPAPIESHSQAWQTRIALSINDPLVNDTQLGNRFHEVVAHCYSKKDFEMALQNENETEIKSQLERLLFQIKTEEHRAFFEAEHIWNERPLLNDLGQMLRPDRLVKDHQGHYHLFDYKTGQPKPEHEEQMARYEAACASAGMPLHTISLLYI